MTDTDSEMRELRAEVSMLEGEVDFLTGEVAGLEQEAAILDLGWSRSDLDLYSTSFLLSRSKAEQEEHERRWYENL